MSSTAAILARWEEAEAPLGPPVGADAESTRLSETVSVGLPSEGEYDDVVGLVPVVPPWEEKILRGMFSTVHVYAEVYSRLPHLFVFGHSRAVLG